MSDPIARQLDSIQSMLTRGQRNLRMERHSLILWGLAGAALFAVSDRVFTVEQIPDTAKAKQRAAHDATGDAPLRAPQRPALALGDGGDD